jgi:hypothetical protein
MYAGNYLEMHFDSFHRVITKCYLIRFVKNIPETRNESVYSRKKGVKWKKNVRLRKRVAGIISKTTDIQDTTSVSFTLSRG